MAGKAKIAGRNKSSKRDEDFEPYTVINAETGRRVFLGEGVPEKEAHRLSDNLLAASYVAPVAELDRFGIHTKPATEAVADGADGADGADEAALDEAA